ncbi:hypothetical protein LTS17_010583 [Exophiala oligosperma]
MFHTVHDINPARLNSIMPILQQMADDPAFLEYRERRFEQDDPPWPYSSRSTTRESTPGPFDQPRGQINLAELLGLPLSSLEIDIIRRRFRLGGYDAVDRYNDEVRLEQERICKASRRRDENYTPLYRGPDLVGTRGLQRLHIMIRHSIKKRWQQLGVWDPEWEVPTSKLGEFGESRGPVHWPWCNSRDKVSLESRAVRRYLQKKAARDENETLMPQPVQADGIAEVPEVDDHESPITSRPWFLWALEVTEEEVRLRRNPERLGTYVPARANVTARWKEKGYWKDSWSNNLPQYFDWRDSPGWKWRHESPSPEPPDPNDMDFTPSEVDALEAIPPPTPSPPVVKPEFDPPPPPGAHPMAFLFWKCRNAPSPESTPQKFMSPTDDGGDHEASRPETVAELTSGKSAAQRLLVEDNVDVAPCAEQSRSSSTRATSSRKQQRPPPTTRHHSTRSNGRTARSAAAPVVEIPSPPPAPKTRQARSAAGGPASSSQLSKPTPNRRSSRIAERKQRAEVVRDPPNEALKAMNKDDVTAKRQMKQHVKGTPTRTTTRRETERTKGKHPPKASSKPQGVAKRKACSRRLNA